MSIRSTVKGALPGKARPVGYRPSRFNSVSNAESVTQWIEGLKAGDSDDIPRLWDRYFARLVRLAGAGLPGHCRRAFHEEDVAISALPELLRRRGAGSISAVERARGPLAVTGDAHGPQSRGHVAQPESAKKGGATCSASRH